MSALAVSARKWETKPFSEVVDILDSQRIPVNSEERAKRVGDVPSYGATGQVGSIDKHIFDEELVLLGEDGAPFLDSGKPKAYLIRGKSWVNNHAHVLRGKPGLLNPFLLYQLNNLNYRPYVSGTTRLKLPQGPMKRIPLLVPPEDEQRRIVGEIEKQFSRLEEGVGALKRVQANLKRYRAAVLKTICEGDWPRKPLGEIAEVKLGKMLDKSKHVAGRKLPYLRNVNVRWGKIDTDDVNEMFFKENELGRYGLKAGDVLVCEGGEPGRAAVWSGDLPEMKYQKAIHRVRFNIPFDPRLLVWQLERLAFTGGLERRFTGSTIKHFTREAFVELPVPIPPPKEKLRIVAEVERRLSVVEEMQTTVEANLQRATRLRQSILQKAFEGKLA